MKLSDEQIARIKSNYNNWEECDDIVGDDWINGYQSGIYDTLLDLGYTREEAKSICEI